MHASRMPRRHVVGAVLVILLIARGTNDILAMAYSDEHRR